jgi:NADH dehydrogenase FAD-containing subunit
MSRHRVVVIGSGFGGLTATKALKHAPVDVTMIARTQHHLFQPLLYQVATGILSEGEFLTFNRGQVTITERQALGQRPVEEPTQPDSAAKAA